ncbi:phage portal protein [Clostridium sp. 001]|uniref:phage portal protein n=1 Tax=Clostridium sp. 001 TaxID=1970093 RepID=UPI001C2C2583|nr:phage portal protein [Clostridium sp. 001]QXE20445.1 phage portal protein [Clostridium sp. 001]
MGFWDWTKHFFGPDKDTIYITQKAIEQSNKLNIERFGIVMAINFIANAVSKCEFKTFLNGKEVKGDEYYLWNIEPNLNESSTQFSQRLISHLLFYGEALVIDVNGQLLVADSFNQVEYAVVENYFTDVSVKTMNFSRTFKMSEVMYFRLNDTNIRTLLADLVNGYEELNNMAEGKYKRSGGRKGIVHLNKPANGDKEFQKKVDDLFKNQFKEYFEAENAVIHLYSGMEYAEQQDTSAKKSTSEITDIQNITKEAFDRIAQAFRIPPSLLRGDIADIEKITDNFLSFCIDPLVTIIGEEATRKRYGKQAFINGSYIKVDTTCIRHIDIFNISEAFDKLIASGGYSIDDLRIKAGDTPLNTDWSKRHWITKNYQDVNTIEGGDK